MKEVVIFDLGGVLIDWNPRYVYREIFNNEEEMEYFLEHITTSEWNEEQDAGRSLSEATEMLVEMYPQHEINIRKYYGEWRGMLKGAIAQSVKILERLKKENNVRLYALTNWSAETFPFALKTFNFLEWFDGIVVSGEEKLKKPDPQIYHLLLSRYSLDASVCVFIDDNLRNVEAARACGIDSIHFETPSQMLKELRKRGI